MTHILGFFLDLLFYKQKKKKSEDCSLLGNELQSLSCSCGSCGYELNLSSGNRNTSTIGCKYGKSIKRGIISFFYIDESRFTQVDEILCIPHFSKRSWGLIRHRTKLLCRKCGNEIGIASNDFRSPLPLVSDGSDFSSGNEVSVRRKYDVKIRALQPSSSEESGVPFFPWHPSEKACLFVLVLSENICSDQAKNFLGSLFIWRCLPAFVWYFLVLSVCSPVHNSF